MPRGIRVRGFALTLGIVLAGLALARPAPALTIGFTAWVLSFEGREPGVVPSYSLQGQPNDPPFPGAPPGGLGFEHEVVLVEYDTSGLPYYVSNVTYTASSLTKFATTADFGVAQPVTLPSNQAAPGGSTAPAGSATITPATGFGNKLSQNFTLGEFSEGNVNAELTYVQINNAAGELAGVKYGNSLETFQGSLVTVTFTPKPGADPAFSPFSLTDAFAIQSSPPYNAGPPDSARATFNFGSAGIHTNLTGPQATVPEPGSLATLVGIGVSGSVFFMKKRRRPLR